MCRPNPPARRENISRPFVQFSSARCTPCHAVPCHAMPCHALCLPTMPSTTPCACHAMPCHSDIVPIRSWTRTLRLPGIRHRHLPCHAMPCHAMLCVCLPCHPPHHAHATPCHAMVTLSLSEAGPGRFGCQAPVTDIYHAMPCHLIIVLPEHLYEPINENE